MSMIPSREQLLAALTVGLRLAEISPRPPFGVQTRYGRGDDYRVLGLVLHMHDPEEVTALAAALNVDTAEECGEFDDVPYVDTVAQGELDGVPWLAWARVNVTASEAVAA